MDMAGLRSRGILAPTSWLAANPARRATRYFLHLHKDLLKDWQKHSSKSSRVSPAEDAGALEKAHHHFNHDQIDHLQEKRWPQSVPARTNWHCLLIPLQHATAQQPTAQQSPQHVTAQQPTGAEAASPSAAPRQPNSPPIPVGRCGSCSGGPAACPASLGAPVRRQHKQAAQLSVRVRVRAMLAWGRVPQKPGPQPGQ